MSIIMIKNKIHNNSNIMNKVVWCHNKVLRIKYVKLIKKLCKYKKILLNNYKLINDIFINNIFRYSIKSMLLKIIL